MSIEIDKLFVYGTLLKNFDNEMAVYLKNNSVFLGKGFFRGKLFDLGEYPGAIYEPASDYKVYGNIFELKNITATLGKLDEYEEVGDKYGKPNEYRREIIDIFYNDSVIKCWVYLFNRDTKNYPQIISGGYLGFQNKNVL